LQALQRESKHLAWFSSGCPAIPDPYRPVGCRVCNFRLTESYILPRTTTYTVQNLRKFRKELDLNQRPQRPKRRILDQTRPSLQQKTLTSWQEVPFLVSETNKVADELPFTETNKKARNFYYSYAGRQNGKSPYNEPYFSKERAIGEGIR
jgi:hypothetical protein